MKDTVLSLDVGPDDCLYRILRESEGSKRVVYVVLKHLDLIPEESRSSGPEVIRHLSRLAEWPARWRTLTIGPSRVDADEFEPHALSQRQQLGNYEYVDILTLAVDESVKHRSFRVRHAGAHGFLKIARFAFELDWLAQEVQAHHVLAHRDASLAPRILAYAYEETRERVVGLLFEEVTGRRPVEGDLEACRAALQKLHDLDIIHGDVVGDNMFVTDEGGVKFIDFEESCIGPIGDEGEWRLRKEDEMQSLKEKFLKESARAWTAHDRL